MFEIVSGYPGTAEIALAMERGEVDGIGVWIAVTFFCSLRAKGSRSAFRAPQPGEQEIPSSEYSQTYPQEVSVQVGDMVYFWTGRGSHGYAIIRELKGPLVLLDPEPDAVKGSDATKTRWAPRDIGIPRDQIDTTPHIWFTNF